MIDLWEYFKNPDTWLSVIAIILSIIALYQTSYQVKLSNKQQLFERRLSRYLEFKTIHSLYAKNKLFLKEEDTFYHTTDLVFSWLVNCSDLEEMTHAVFTPLHEDKQKVFLTKHEQLKNAANEIEMIFDGRIAKIAKAFISVYADLLMAMYKQQVYITEVKKRENDMPQHLEDYKSNCKRMAESLGILQMCDELEKLEKDISRKQIMKRMKKSLRLTR